ncbi:hypothetical protein BS47DRAFT_641929 [Hydnum rufescens UP504]|uniref:Aminotransferase class I/classII large domain-containing protein n=1 Tax=Hydnum rufescens UP504 TaxID=1448309 RepID=A0A9P6BA29_9AGAM|nr:hypothetical protein BS47DRAFT_641929 [Hydnum rufescens UP504]
MPPNAVDLKHHLSFRAHTRKRERLAQAYPRGDETLINMDGGVPFSEYYPFETISSRYLSEDAFPIDPHLTPQKGVFSWLTDFFTSPSSATRKLEITRHAQKPDDFEISTLMNYSPGTGLAPLETYIQEFIRRVYRPAYTDWNILIDIGAGDAFSKVLEVVTNPGDCCLVDDWSYNFSLAQMKDIGILPVPVKVDSIGLIPSELHRTLASWDETTRRRPRPRILLQVPAGQNPLGTTLTAQRKQDIYKVAVEWDLLIVEDDPYYFQQFGPYSHQTQVARTTAYAAEGSDQAWIDSLVPSFLRYDYQGRVIRLDTFSKTVGPGGRLGYFTTSPLLREHLMLAQNGRSFPPSGISQALIGTLLKSWGHDGFIRWLRGLRGQYRLRRDLTIDLFYRHFDIQQEYDSGQSVLVAYPHHSQKGVPDEKPGSRKSTALFEFVPPSTGMFIWIKVYLENHPSFAELSRQTSLAHARSKLSLDIWQAIMDAGVRLRPGFVFQNRTDEERDAEGDTAGYMRLSYATATHEQLEKGVEDISRAFHGFFQV